MRLVPVLPFGLAVLLGSLLLAAPLLAVAIPFPEGRLFRVERPDIPVSYVFGTMHADDPEVVSLPEAVATAFRDARTLVMEVVPDADTILRSMLTMAFTDGTTLEEAVGADLYARTVEAAERVGMIEAAIRDLKPWAIATMLSVPPAASGEFLDLRLYRQAVEDGKPVDGLETIEEQLGVFDNLSAEAQARFLEHTLSELPGVDDLYAELRDAYLKGDLARLQRLNDTHLAGTDPALKGYLDEELVECRNARMAERLEPLLWEGGVFVAVGALHLPGLAGLLHLLEDRGWSVERAW